MEFLTYQFLMLVLDTGVIIKRKKVNYTQRSHIVRCCGKKSCYKFQAKPGKGGKKIKSPKSLQSKPIRIGDKNYMFPEEKATYAKAKEECAKNGLELASIGSAKEQKNVNEYLDYIGVSSDIIFTALDALSGGAKASVTWGTGPPPPGGTGECPGFYNGALYNASCVKAAHYACEGEAKTGLSSLLPINQAPFSFIGGKNYLLPAEKASVPEAENLCKKQGMQLMSLDSLAETNLVQDFLSDIGLSTSTMLTSLKKMSGGDETNWLGGIASNFLKWAPNEPAANGGDCSALDGLGLKGINCDSVSNFVCEAPGNSVQKIEDPLSQLLSMAQPLPFSFGDQQYILPSETATFENAQKICETKDMDLITIDTPKELSFVNGYMDSLGLTDTPLLTSMAKTSGSFGSLGAGLQLESGGSGDCSAVSDVGLIQTPCGAKTNFMCEAPKNATTKTILQESTLGNINNDQPAPTPASATDLKEDPTTAAAAPAYSPAIPPADEPASTPPPSDPTTTQPEIPTTIPTLAETTTTTTMSAAYHITSTSPLTTSGSTSVTTLSTASATVTTAITTAATTVILTSTTLTASTTLAQTTDSSSSTTTPATTTTSITTEQVTSTTSMTTAGSTTSTTSTENSTPAATTEIPTTVTQTSTTTTELTTQSSTPAATTENLTTTIAPNTTVTPPAEIATTTAATDPATTVAAVDPVLTDVMPQPVDLCAAGSDKCSR